MMNNRIHTQQTMIFIFHIANQLHTTKVKNLVCAYYPNAKIQSIEKFKLDNHVSNNERLYIFADNYNTVTSELNLNGINIKNIFLIMISESNHYAIDCLRKGFYDYLLLNKLQTDFKMFSDRLNAQLLLDSKRNINNYILIKDHKSITKLQYTDILFIEAHGSYSNVYTSNKFFTVTKTIKSLIQNFPESFIRVHRSYLINLGHVKSYCSEEVIMNNDFKIKIARTKKMALIEAIQKTA